MPIITPTITAFSLDQYRDQMKLITPFAKRIHIDLMDGEFAPTKSPDLAELWGPDNKDIIVDLHVMYQRPQEHLEAMRALKPNMVIFHREADVDHAAFAKALHDAGIKAGIALLQKTAMSTTEELLHVFEHLLVFSGNLGYHGGSTTDLSLLEKAKRALELKPDIELGWDGGINDEVACDLVRGGIQVLNTGGFIHKAENPHKAFEKLQALIDAL